MTAQLKAIPQEDYDPLVHETPLAGYLVGGGDVVKVERDGDDFTVYPAEAVEFGKVDGVALFPAKLGAPVVILSSILGVATSPTTMRFQIENRYVLVVSREETE